MSDDQAQQVPDYAMPVVAWRLWRVGRRGELYSPQQGTLWQSGYNDAACPHAGKSRARYVPTGSHVLVSIDGKTTEWVDDCSFQIFTVPKHTAPGDDCECGFYAVDKPTDAVARGWSSRRRVNPANELVLGTVEIVGDAMRHRDGWRAGRARVASLVTSVDDKIDARIARAQVYYDAQLHRPGGDREITEAAVDLAKRQRHEQLGKGDDHVPGTEITPSSYRVGSVFSAIRRDFIAAGGANHTHISLYPSRPRSSG